MATKFAGDARLGFGGSRGVETPAARVLADECVAELAETALEVTLRQGVNRPSVDLEIALWRSLQSAVGENKRRLASATVDLKPDRKLVLARLTEAAYRTALLSGLKGSFIDLEIGLWNAFSEVRNGRCR